MGLAPIRKSRLPRMPGATLVQLLAVWVMVGVAVALSGVLPRFIQQELHRACGARIFDILRSFTLPHSLAAGGAAFPHPCFTATCPKSAGLPRGPNPRT